MPIVCCIAHTCTCGCLSPTRIEQMRMEQTVIRKLNGLSVVVNCSLCGKVGTRTVVSEEGSAQVFPLMMGCFLFTETPPCPPRVANCSFRRSHLLTRFPFDTVATFFSGSNGFSINCTHSVTRHPPTSASADLQPRGASALPVGDH